MTALDPESATTILVIAKQPVPGRVETRLVPPRTPERAAALAEAALADTLHTVLRVPALRRVLALDGEPGAWMPSGFDIVPQCGDPLGERLAGAFSGAVFGPAADGGFWALGLRVPDPALLRGVPMSTPGTGAIQRSRLLAAGLRVAELPCLRDVDTAADAVAVARQAPRSRFAARARELATVLSQADRGLEETA